MRWMIPLMTVLALGCGEAEPGDGAGDDTPKTRSNERGEIERHLGEGDRGDAPPSEVGAEPRAEAETEPRRVRTARRVIEPAPQPEAAPEPTVAEATPEPAPAVTPEASAEAPSSITVSRLVVASAIENREPTGAAPFAADVERVYLFVEARNDGEDSHLTVTWIEPDGTEGAPIELAVPNATRWRTWATTRRASGRPGTWSVVVESADGVELGRERFVVESEPSA